jgi:Zn-dependent peptidase ImmA (M78 family)
MIEIGAEVFAAEFIYPEQEFLACVAQLDIKVGNCTPEHVVELKRGCGAQVSYTFLRKRLEWFEIVTSGEFAKVQFQKLEESIYGPPIYKQAWFKRYRARKQKA